MNNSVISNRKRYKCPICGEYELMFFIYGPYKCLNDCFLTDEHAKGVREKNDYIELVNSDEYREIFSNEFDLLMTQIHDDTELVFRAMSKSKRKRITNLFQRSKSNDMKLDDLVIDNLNGRDIDNLYIDPFGYLINVIEDIHYYANGVLRELGILLRTFNITNTKFHSSRFFFSNIISNVFRCYERIYVVLGIMYGYEFKEQLKHNTTSRIKNTIKKNEKFKHSEVKTIVDNLNGGNQAFKDLLHYRAKNDHDLSSFNELLDEDINTGSITLYDVFNTDPSKLDEKLFKDKLGGFVGVSEAFYDIIDSILKSLNDETFVFRETPMQSEFQRVDFENLVFPGEINLAYLHELRLNNFEHLTQYRNRIGWDIFFRMDEVVRCIGSASKIEDNLYYSKWNPVVGFDLSDVIDTEYMIHSITLRLYSCFDKYSRLISENSIYDDVKYFEDYKKYDASGRFINIIKDVLDSGVYDDLYYFRNVIQHNMRPGRLNGDDGVNYFNNIVLQRLYLATLSFYKMIEDIDSISHNQLGRNDKCDCGSEIKYKKCCMNELNWLKLKDKGLSREYLINANDVTFKV